MVASTLGLLTIYTLIANPLNLWNVWENAIFLTKIKLFGKKLTLK